MKYVFSHGTFAHVATAFLKKQWQYRVAVMSLDRLKDTCVYSYHSR